MNLCLQLEKEELLTPIKTTRLIEQAKQRSNAHFSVVSVIIVCFRSSIIIYSSIIDRGIIVWLEFQSIISGCNVFVCELWIYVKTTKGLILFILTCVTRFTVQRAYFLEKWLFWVFPVFDYPGPHTSATPYQQKYFKIQCLILNPIGKFGKINSTLKLRDLQYWKDIIIYYSMFCLSSL